MPYGQFYRVASAQSNTEQYVCVCVCSCMCEGTHFSVDCRSPSSFHFAKYVKEVADKKFISGRRKRLN